MKTFQQFITEATRKYDPDVQGRSQIRQSGEGGRIQPKRKITPAEKNLLMQIFRFFTQADVEVNNYYMGHCMHVFKPTEVKMMLSVFSAMETVHVAAY